VSPSGKKVAVASFQVKRWDGEIEDLQTDIYEMNVEGTPNRMQLFKNGGWPTWGSDDVIFFHRKVDGFWGVFRYTISTKETVRVTPETFDAVTPAAISETKVAVATIRQKSKFDDQRVEAQYRHIEIFDVAAPGQPPVKITQKTRPKGDHFNPFVLDGGGRVGYHRCKSDLLKDGDDVPRNFHKLESPAKDIGLFRVSGVFPTISKDGSKLAFVDNEFKAVWLADSQGLRIVYLSEGPDSVFAPMWNQNPEKDILYICMGPSFNSKMPLEIHAIPKVSTKPGLCRLLTKGDHNNAFPSSSPDGNRFVFRSTRYGGEKKYKNLFIMENQKDGEYMNGKVTRLTEGEWTDTHCQWSPNGDWIVFSSTRDKPKDAPPLDNGLDPGYFAVYLVNPSNPSVVVRVLQSSPFGGHVNHPVFSPDGRSIAVTADLAAVTVDPISLPLFLHSVRPYGDIFLVDINTKDILKNKDVKKFLRITHSRYEYSTPAWTMFATDDPNAQWSVLLKNKSYTPGCPYAYPDGGESWHMTGHLCIPRRCC
jgi:Tol biopolymer transport system component